MMTMKTWAFYTSIVAALCGGAGTGAYLSDAYFSPTAHERAMEIRAAQLEALQNCEMTAKDRAWFSGPVNNTNPKDY